MRWSWKYVLRRKLMSKKVASANSIVSFNILSTLILQGLTFFTAPIISRMLGADNYGIAAVYVTWVSLCLLYTSPSPRD